VTDDICISVENELQTWRGDFNMDIKQHVYPADSTLDALNQSCQIDEDTFRARLIELGRLQTDGVNANRASFQRVELNEPYVTKNLSFRDITKSAPDQVPEGYAPAFKAEVFLNGEPATIVVYREQ
jgi:hypothetical protein